MKAALSIAFENLRGKAGTVVVSKARSGLFVRSRITGKNPRTPAQQAVRADMGKAAAAYKNMTPTQAANWRTYALTITKTNRVTGETYHASAITAFTGLAVKFLQINPEGAIPTNPPATGFLGDPITVSATPGTGKVTFTATAANRPGVKTELLLQKLPSQNRAPDPKAYRTKAFVTFAVGSLSADIIVPPGYYAAAYRFVDPSTGQSTDLQPLTTNQVTFALEEGKPNKKAA